MNDRTEAPHASGLSSQEVSPGVGRTGGAATAEPITETLRVGIVGAGQIARVHGPQIRRLPHAEIVAVADRDLSRARRLASELEIRDVYSTVESLVEGARPHVVHALVPPLAHAEVSIAAMERGCHVLVEKPLALTVAEASRMLATAKRHGVALRVDHCMLYERVIARALRAVERGDLGDPVSIQVNVAYDARRNRHILEPGAQYNHWMYALPGGPLQDLFPHPASLLTSFFSEFDEVHTVRASRGVLPGGADDELRVLTRSGDRFGSINLSLAERPDAVTLTIRGTRGELRADLYANTLVTRRVDGLPRAISRGLSGFRTSRLLFSDALANVFRVATGRIDKSGGIGPLIEHFYEELRRGDRVTTEGAASVRLMNEIWPPDEAGPAAPVMERERSPGPSVFVTGATGFIGTHLLEDLRTRPGRTRALVRPDSPRADRAKVPGVEVRQADLSDREDIIEAVAGADVIVHAGGATGGGWEEHRRSTIEGTRHVIEAALTHGVRRLVFFSSLAVYDLEGLGQGDVVEEDHPFHARPERMGPYAHAKIEAERMLMEAYERRGLPVTILRPGLVIGPFGSVFFPHFGYRVGAGLLLLTARRELVLPLTYVDSVVHAVRLAAANDQAVGQAFNIVDDGDVTVGEYLRRLQETAGMPARVIGIPRLLPHAAAAAYEAAAAARLVRPGLTSRAQLRWKQMPVRFSNDRAKNVLGWNPPVELRAGLQRTFEWLGRVG